MSVKLETPPRFTGSTEHQLQQAYSYLFRLSEYLNVALKDIGSVQTAAASTPETNREDNDVYSARLTKTYNDLKSLIINTAEITRIEMERIETSLRTEYAAMSGQWGNFYENIDSTITATALNVVQSLDYEARLSALDSKAAGFEAYQIRSEGYIRSGFIDYDSDGVPIVGIAIGQNLTSTTVTVDGEHYEQLDKTQSCAFYTADRVSFRINGMEVAYVSNQKLYIHDVEITGNVVLGGKWMLGTTGGLRIKWIGG